MKLESGPRLHGSYNNCLKEEPQATKCSDHRTICLIAHTQQRYLEEGLNRKLRMYSEISLDLEEEKELGMQLGCCE